MTRRIHDALIVVDPQFSGGTATSLIADVKAFSKLGLSVGLVPVKSRFLVADFDRPNDEILCLPDLPGVDLVVGSANADVAFFHHPLAFFNGVESRQPITCNKALIVAHHPPFRGDGSLEYSPVATNRSIHSSFGCWPWWAPISGEVRRQLRSFSPFITMTTEDWHNSFELESWCATRAVFEGGSAVVGRHGRSDMLKWPSTVAEIAAPLAPGPDWTTRVMGCPVDDLRKLGVDMRNWEILRFNEISVNAFLDGLDVFCYFYHPRWVEAFGRTVAEAILMQRPCILDPRLEPNFGGLAEFCAPSEAGDLLERMRASPQSTRALAAQRQKRAAELFGTDNVGRRFDQLRDDRGVRSRTGPKSATFPVALRKLVGLWRRRHQGLAREA